VKDVIDQIRYAMKNAQTQHEMNPQNVYWTGKIDGLYHALGLLILNETGPDEMIDLTDAMTADELAAVRES